MGVSKMNRATAYVIGQFVLFWIMAMALLAFPLDQTNELRLVGFVLIVAGFVVIGLAILEHMRRNGTLPYVTPTPNVGVGLIDTGVYARVRHPIYAGVLLGAFGVALVHGHLIPLLIAFMMLVFFTYKSMYEESLLRAAYPDYAAYMRDTGRFLPFR